MHQLGVTSFDLWDMMLKMEEVSHTVLLFIVASGLYEEKEGQIVAQQLNLSKWLILLVGWSEEGTVVNGQWIFNA